MVRDLAIKASNTPVQQDEVEVDQVIEGVSYGQRRWNKRGKGEGEGEGEGEGKGAG